MNGDASHPEGSEAGAAEVARMRATAHPVRLHVLGALRTHGPLTVTRLAHQLGTSTAALSYHVKQLAAADLIEEVPAPAGEPDQHHLNKWWRAKSVQTSWEYPSDEHPGENLAAYMRAVSAVHEDRIRRATEDLASPDSRPPVMSDALVHLTPPQLDRLADVIAEQLQRFADAPATPDSRRYLVQLQMLPLPDET